MSNWQVHASPGFTQVGPLVRADGKQVLGLGVLKTPRKDERAALSRSMRFTPGARYALTFVYRTGYGLEHRGFEELYVALDDWVIWRVDLAAPDRDTRAVILFDAPAAQATLSFGKRGLRDEGRGWDFQSTIAAVHLRPAEPGEEGVSVGPGETHVVPLPEPAPPHTFGDPQAFMTRMAEISDADLFAAMTLDNPALREVQQAVAAADYPAAYLAWGRYWDAKQKIAWAIHGDRLQPIAEIQAELRADPDRVSKAKQAAAPVMRHDIRGWGDVTQQHGDVVDFNYDYGVSGTYGFHYWGWAAPLLTAFHATGDEAYLAEFDRLFNQWYEQRHRVRGAIAGLDPIWYELGLGLRNRQFLHYYTCPYSARSPQTHERMLKTALGAGRWLCRLQSQEYRGGNWQIMGSYGLADIAARLPEFREADAWLDIAVQRLAEHVERDFFADGCHSERVPTSYMHVAYQDPRRLMVLLRAAGVANAATERFGSRLEKVLEWWMYAANPLGGLPALNDGSSRALPTAVLREGAALYERPDFLYVAEKLGEGKAHADGMPPAQTSIHLAPSAAVVMRSGWERDHAYLFLNYGTHGGGHTHRAALDFELFGAGAPLALDAGIGLTYDDPLHRPWYTTARAHNMLVVDHADVERRTARGRDVLWHSDQNIDVFAASHDGYRDSHGLSHRRSIVFLKPAAFVVFDSCTATRAGQTLSWMFHSPTDLVVGEQGRVSSAKGPGVVLLDASPDQLDGIRKGQGMCSLSQFGGYRNIDWIAYDRTTRVGSDNHFGIAMLPFADHAPEDVDFTALPCPNGAAAFSLRRGEITDILVFGAGGLLTLLDDRLVTDAPVAWLRLEPGAAPRGIALQGTTLTWEDRPVPTP